MMSARQIIPRLVFLVDPLAIGTETEVRFNLKQGQGPFFNEGLKLEL